MALDCIISKERDALRTTYHVMREDACGKKFAPTVLSFNALNCFSFNGGETNVFSKPFLSFGNVPEPTFAGGMKVFVEENWQVR